MSASPPPLLQASIFAVLCRQERKRRKTNRKLYACSYPSPRPSPPDEWGEGDAAIQSTRHPRSSSLRRQGSRRPSARVICVGKSGEAAWPPNTSSQIKSRLAWVPGQAGDDEGVCPLVHFHSREPALSPCSVDKREREEKQTASSMLAVAPHLDPLPLKNGERGR